MHGTTFLFRGRPHVLGVLRDVSNEVEATRLLEQRVAERTHELASLLSLANQAAATRELSQLVAVVLPEVERMLACSWAGVYLADDGALVRVAGADDASEPHRVPVSDSWGLLVRGETAIGQADLEALFPQRVSASCSLVVPLAASGETIGVLCLARPKGQPFGDEQRALARGVADQLSVAISNARYFEATQQTAALERRRVSPPDAIRRAMTDPSPPVPMIAVLMTRTRLSSRLLGWPMGGRPVPLLGPWFVRLR